MSDLTVTPVVAPAEGSSGAQANVEGQLLVLVLDINPNQPFFARNPKYIVNWLESALALANAHLMLRTSNSVAAVAAHSSGCSFLYPAPDPVEVAKPTDGQFEGFHHVEATIRLLVKRILLHETEPGTPVNSDSLLAGALCMALSYIHRRRRELDPVDLPARILVMSASDDTAKQYMTYMNCFFSAQKMSVPLDACLTGSRDSGLLQQGADITGGLYQRLRQRHLPALLQFLLWAFLSPAASRSKLSLPSAERVDYRAACFCHRELVDIGFVCSVCLSIFCKFSPICPTCQSVFKRPGPLPVMKKKRISAATNSR